MDAGNERTKQTPALKDGLVPGATDQLCVSDEQYHLAIQNVRDYAIFTMDPQRMVTSWNQGAQRILGWLESEMVGQPGDTIFTREDRESGEPEKEVTTARDEGCASDERWHLRKDGTRFWGSGVVTPVIDRKGEPRGYVKIMRDETQRRLWEEQIRQHRDELEKRVAERTEELHEANEGLKAEIAVRERAEGERQQLLAELVASQESERARIARELHDQMGQQLAALMLGLTAVRESAADQQMRDRLENLRMLAETITREMHDLAVELRPPALDQYGLRVSIENLLDDWVESTGLHAEMQWLFPEDLPLPSSHQVALYRITQEALTNVARHAEASNVILIFRRVDGFVHFLLEDDGKGFNMEDRASSHQRLGLLGMRERAALINATLTIESTPGRGTSIICRVPINEKAAAAHRDSQQ